MTDSVHYLPGALINGFVVDRIAPVPELRSTARLFVHQKTGARLLHMVNDDPDNLFCIAFPTPVSDNTGVPHILEHSVLCGSEKFPVKDPFQVLLKSSLQTFLNAMTYPDKTIYPVSSQVEKDFYNLVDVYCDAVLHPLLTENMFRQEGWHFDLEKPEGPVGIKGIVYNEMKGVFSDFSSHVVRRTFGGLFPDATYQWESGGEPRHITDLTYQAFRAFHRRYYDPSNGFIFLYGNLPTAKTLAFLDEKYLSAFERGDGPIRIDPQPLWSAPRTIAIDAPCETVDEGKATVVLAWLFCDSTDPVAALAGSVLSRYLIATESSPLRRALVDSGLGEDLDDMSGFDVDVIQGVFAVGLRKTKPEHAEKIRDLVFDVLRREVEKGMDPELLEGALRRVEFSLREISDAGRVPFGLRLAERCYRSWIYGGDPLAHLSFEAPLSRLKDGFHGDPAYFVGILRERLLDNKHILLSTVTGSAEAGRRLEELTVEQARRLSAGFGPADLKRCWEEGQQLLEEQKKPIAPEALAVMPKLDKTDLPPRGVETPVERDSCAGRPLIAHPIFCGGISYLDIGFDASVIPADLHQWLPFYAEFIARCGAGKYSSEEMAVRISLATGGISAGLMIDTPVGSETAPVVRLFVHAKALADRFDGMTAILADLFTLPRLNDPKLIADLVLEMRNDFQASIIQSGNSVAAGHAAGRLDPVRQLAELTGGITQLRFLNDLATQPRTEAIVDALTRIHRILMAAKETIVSLTADTPFRHRESMERLMNQIPADLSLVKQALSPSLAVADAIGIEINASVNYVSRAWQIAPQNAADLGIYSLLGANLSRGALWDTVRVEGGAYGAFASLGATYPVFSCASYRDPNLVKTLERFDAALGKAAKGLESAAIDESIVATIGQIDKPRAPHARGFGETGALLLGRTPAFRQAIRDSVLSATSKRVATKAAEILDARLSVVTVLGSAASMDQAIAEGMKLTREKLI